MKTMNFYTQNGWAGSNYDSKLSTKGIAAKVRSYAKKNFPEFKFSIRTEWSMYTDSMYIELKEGTCIPFVEGSRSAERGYMNTMNTVKGWEKELTPEMFKALDAVTVYANSFKYDDSDSMQDYFDTNFYLNIKISEEYKVIEPKVKKSSVKPEKVEEAKGMGAVTVEGLEIVDYSEKAIVVFGDTKAIKEQLKELGGRFNPFLNYNGEKRAGWIFSKKKADKVRELLAPAKSEKEADEITEEAYPLENIHFTETGSFNGVCYYDIEGAGIITGAKVREDIQPGDVFNVYTDKERKHGVTYDGVSLNKSLYNTLPGMIEFDNKIEVGILSASSHYKPMVENVEFYEKKVKGMRYTINDKPSTLGYYGVLDNLDNCIIDCFQTEEEAEKEKVIFKNKGGNHGQQRTKHRNIQELSCKSSRTLPTYQNRSRNVFLKRTGRREER